jgi:hypothetical protein
MALTALDYEKIKQLHATFAQSLDFGDAETFTSCFAEEGTYCEGGETHRDAAELRAFATESFAISAGHVRHAVVASPLIDGDGADARSLSYVCGTRDYGPAVGEGQFTRSRLLRSGLYEDVLLKVADDWKYASRTFHRDGHDGVLQRFEKPLEIAHVDASASAETDATGMTALDYEAIRQLTTRYGYTLDFADADGFVDVFTEDGAFELLTLGDPDFGGQGRIAGSKELYEMALALGPRVLGHVRHGAVNTLVEGDGNTASASAYGFFTTDHGKPPRSTEPDSFMIETTGIYRDELVKRDGVWRYQTRTFRYDGWPDVLNQVGAPLELSLFAF